MDEEYPFPEEDESNMDDSDGNSEDDSYEEEEELDEYGLPKFKLDATSKKSDSGLAEFRGAGVDVMGPSSMNIGPRFDVPVNFAPPFINAPQRIKTPALMIGVPPVLIPTEISVLKSNWNVPHPIPPKPDFYELQQTATFVPEVKSTTVATRISECLRKLSIDGRFDDDNANAIAVTEDSAEFEIQLYAGKGNYSHGIIVEVKKHRGIVQDYHRVISAVFRASRGDFTHKDCKNIDIDNINFGHFGIDLDDTEALESSKKTIKYCDDILREGHLDVVLFGLERLSTLVDGSKLGSVAALRNSGILLEKPEGEFIRTTIASLIEHKCLPLQQNELDQYETSRLRKLAYFILSNTLSVLCERGRLSGDGAHKWFFDDLICCLVEDIKNAVDNPHEAYMASKCLVSLVKVDAGAMLKAQLLEASVALTLAQLVGKSRHARLSEQTSTALEIFAE